MSKYLQFDYRFFIKMAHTIIHENRHTDTRHHSWKLTHRHSQSFMRTDTQTLAIIHENWHTDIRHHSWEPTHGHSPSFMKTDTQTLTSIHMKTDTQTLAIFHENWHMDTYHHSWELTHRHTPSRTLAIIHENWHMDTHHHSWELTHGHSLSFVRTDTRTLAIIHENWHSIPLLRQNLLSLFSTTFKTYCNILGLACSLCTYFKHNFIFSSAGLLFYVFLGRTLRRSVELNNIKTDICLITLMLIDFKSYLSKKRKLSKAGFKLFNF